jgi:hypothetical protein
MHSGCPHLGHHALKTDAAGMLEVDVFGKDEFLRYLRQGVVVAPNDEDLDVCGIQAAELLGENGSSHCGVESALPSKAPQLHHRRENRSLRGRRLLAVYGSGRRRWRRNTIQRSFPAGDRKRSVRSSARRPM